MSVEPRCPYCSAKGVKEIAVKRLAKLAWVVYCGKCGAIFGVVPIPKNKEVPPAEKDSELTKKVKDAFNPTEDNTGDPYRQPRIEIHRAKEEPKTPQSEKRDRPLTPEESVAMMDYYYQFNRGTNQMRIDRSVFDEDGDNDGE